MSPFEAMFGRPSSTLSSYILGTTTVQVMEEELLDREEILRSLKACLLKAQQRMKRLANLHHTDRDLQVGQRVLIRLQPFWQHSVVHRANRKIGHKFFEPFQENREDWECSVQITVA